MSYRIINGDCREVMRGMADGSVDSIVCDPPYLLEFMGKEFDRQHKEMDGVNIGQKMQTWHLSWAREAYRVLKPGGHILAFGGTRTGHRLATAIEDAGLEVRDCLGWITGSGFPKSLNVSRALEDSLPADALCACALGYSQTVLNSQADCRPDHGSDDGPLRAAQDSDGDELPSQADAPTHTPVDSLEGDRVDKASRNRSTSSDRHSTCCLPLLSEAPADFQCADSAPTGKPSNTSNDELKAGRKKAQSIRRRQHLGGGSAAFSSHPQSRWNANLPLCRQCGKIKVQQGLGTSLKPAWEMIYLARRPLAGTVAQNVLEHGTGALNIDASRIALNGIENHKTTARPGLGKNGIYGASTVESIEGKDLVRYDSKGRWPANVIHDGSDEVEAAFAAFGERKVGKLSPHHKRGEQVNCYGKSNGAPPSREFGGDTGSASRFFMKCSPDDPEFYECESCGVARHISELTRGCPQCGQTMTPLECGEGSRFHYCAKAGRSERWKHIVCSCRAQVIPPTHIAYKLKHCPLCGDEFKVTAHPTQKPESLMRYLSRLITPPGGTLLDPFAGSGSTGCAALAEGFDFIGIEMDETYAMIAEQRIAAAVATVQTDLFTGDQLPVTDFTEKSMT